MLTDLSVDIAVDSRLTFEKKSVDTRTIVGRHSVETRAKKSYPISAFFFAFPFSLVFVILLPLLTAC